MKTLSDLILKKNDFKALITTEEFFMKNSTESVIKMIEKIEESKTTIKQENHHLQVTSSDFKNYIKFDIQINFCSQSILTVPYLHEDYPYMLILSSLLRWKYLHTEIREKGGAYGSKSYQGMIGIFYLGTYRDPNTIRSINVFKNSIEKICEGNFDDNDIYEGQLQVFQSLDAPTVPEAKIFDLFFHGISDEQKMKIRNVIFNVKKEKLIECCKKHLLDKKISMTIIGPKSNIEKDILENWKIVEA